MKQKLLRLFFSFSIYLIVTACFILGCHKKRLIINGNDICSVTSIMVSPENININVAQTQQFTANGTLPNGIILDVTSSVLWNSSANEVATITSSGLATALTQGSTMITAKLPTTCAQSITSNVANLSVMAATATRFYILNFNNNTIAIFDEDQLVSNGAPTPVIIVSGGAGSFQGGGNLIFDSLGNLWVTNYTFPTYGTSIVQFTNTQLTATNTPVPNLTISANAGSLQGPLGGAFDGSGNLWIPNAKPGVNTIVKYTSTQISTTGNPPPNLTISANSGSLNHPNFLTFDNSGNLWVTNGTSATIVKYTAAQIATTGTINPVPDLIISANSGSLNGPIGIIFDNSGNLWVTNSGSSTIVKYTAAQIATSGTINPVPDVIVSANSGSLDFPTAIAIFPIP